MDLKKIRDEYLQKELNLSDLDSHPFTQLKNWFELALKAEITYPNAANLATVDANGIPHSRIILIKDIKSESVTFFTDYSSDKGNQIEHNQNICLNIFWKEFDRQVRMNGIARKISHEESEAYFQSRPKESQISATASQQSKKVNKEELVGLVKELTQKYADQEILPCPENWGGYEVQISEFEFWQGRPTRLHDRFKYTQTSQGWECFRVSP